MKISGSILAVNDNYYEYAKQLKYAHIDCIHVDIFQNGKYKIKDLLEFDETFPPLDVHLIYETINDTDIEALNKAKVSYVNIQYENLKDKSTIVKMDEDLLCSFGLAFTVNTPLAVIDEYLKYSKQILFMCSEPGISGAGFDERNYERIEEFHRKHPEISICVDGGIDAQKAEFMAALGVSMIVSGSYLCKGYEQLGVNAYSLKHKESVDIKARNKMIPIASLPIVSISDSFERTINVMNRYHLGLDFVVNEDGFCGVIADGDIRRGFIKYGKDIFDKTAGELMNSNPYTIGGDKTIREVYEDISKLHMGIDVIPVINDGRLIGGINLRMGT